MDDNDVNIFKSLGFGVEENVTILTLVVFKVVYNKQDRTVEVGQDVGNR